MALSKGRYMRIFAILLGIILILLFEQRSIVPKRYTMTVYRIGSDVFISYRYLKNTDMHLVIGKCGVNKLISIKAIYLNSNYTDNVMPWGTKRATNFMTSCTDWIGPYTVKSLECDDGGEPSFTGGWHGDSVDGKEIPTANTENFSIRIGNEELSDKKVYYCDGVQISVTNYIQAYNTKKIKRNVLKEEVKYDITPNEVKVEVTSTALEKVLLQRYYGLQAQNGEFESIEYGNGVLAQCREYSDSGTYKKDNIASCFKLFSKKGVSSMVVSLDTGFGLGNFENLSDDLPTIFTQNYGKTYFNLVNGIDKIIEKGDSIKWRGSYEFN
ncbi:MAG: hypothetical protein GX270_06970 [Clostridiaceae bacterium]|nr:hypothetical protein [Clostridiaceae bacterium]